MTWRQRAATTARRHQGSPNAVAQARAASTAGQLQQLQEQGLAKCSKATLHLAAHALVTGEVQELQARKVLELGPAAGRGGQLRAAQPLQHPLVAGRKVGVRQHAVDWYVCGRGSRWEGENKGNKLLCDLATCRRRGAAPLVVTTARTLSCYSCVG